MLRFNSKVSMSSGRFQNGFAMASALSAAAYQLFLEVDDKGKPILPVKCRIPGANGSIPGAITTLMKLETAYNAGSEKTIRQTGIKLSYPANVQGRVKATLGTWIQPARLAALLSFLAQAETPEGMTDAELLAHLNAAGFGHLVEKETTGTDDENKEENAGANRVKESAKIPV